MVSIYHSSAGLNGSTKQQYIYFDSTDFQSYYYTNKYDLRHLFRVFEHVKGTTIIVTIVSMFFFYDSASNAKVELLSGKETYKLLTTVDNVAPDKTVTVIYVPTPVRFQNVHITIAIQVNCKLKDSR